MTPYSSEEDTQSVRLSQFGFCPERRNTGKMPSLHGLSRELASRREERDTLEEDTRGSEISDDEDRMFASEQDEELDFFNMRSHRQFGVGKELPVARRPSSAGARVPRRGLNQGDSESAEEHEDTNPVVPAATSTLALPCRRLAGSAAVALRRRRTA